MPRAVDHQQRLRREESDEGMRAAGNAGQASDHHLPFGEGPNLDEHAARNKTGDHRLVGRQRHRLDEFDLPGELAQSRIPR